MLISKIVCPGKKGDATLALAASELKKLAAKCGNILKRQVAAEFRPGLGGDAYRVALKKGVLVFEHATAADALYAVYDFAEKYLGYCFFEPGRDILAPEARRPLKEGVLIRARPLIKRRGFIQEFPFGKDSRILADWMAKNRMNYLMTWMKYYDKAPAAIKRYFRVRGVEIESGHHNFSYWIPGEKYARSNPDFFAVIDGKRISPSSSKSALLLSEQLCTTNPALRREIVRRMDEYCAANPEVKTISLIPNDGFGWCQCDECSKFYDKNRKGSLHSVSEHVYMADKIYHDMVADVGRMLREKRPGVDMTFCAYVNYSAPSEGFRLDKNLAVHFAPYWRCVKHAIDSRECATNKAYMADLKAWIKAKNGGEVNIYEYYMGVNFYISLPMVHHEMVFDEAALYGRLGVDGLLTQFHIPHWTVYGLNYYMMGKACWGEDKKTSADEAMRKIFGKKAAAAKKFYASTRALQDSAGKCLIPYPRGLFLTTKADDFKKLHKAALALAKGSAKDSLASRLPLWTEYLLRFKELFDAQRAGKAGAREIKAFMRWCKGLPSKRVLVVDKLEMLFGAWLKCVEQGREWVHFNLDWEDAYIRRHDKLFRKRSV